MKRHALHILMCLPMVVAAIVLVALGAGAVALALALVCAVMMGAIVTMAVRDGRGGARS